MKESDFEICNQIEAIFKLSEKEIENHEMILDQIDLIEDPFIENVKFFDINPIYPQEMKE